MNKLYPMRGALYPLISQTSRKLSIALLLLTFMGTCASAQITQIAVQSFESAAMDTWGYTTDPATYSDGQDYWEVRATSASIDPFDGTLLFGGRDIENTSGGQAGDNFINFDEVQLNGASNVFVSFYYNVFEFDGGDDFKYILTVDGVPQPEVFLIDGMNGGGVSTNGWERVQISIPDGSTSVRLQIVVDQDGGGDYFAVDLAEVFTNACGISTFGPEEVVCLTETAAARTDKFQIRIPYTGMDAAATISVEAGATTPANDVTADVVNIGDDPKTVADGTIILENNSTVANRSFIEGNEVRVTLDGGNCLFVREISTTDNQCRNPCDPNINVNNITFSCDAQTDGTDMGSALVPFTNGPEPGVVVSVDDPMVTVGGDDPAVLETGDILLGNLTEGTTYTLTLTGGGCIDAAVKEFTFTFADGTCVPSLLVINEILADPPAGSDANRDGTPSTSGDEFVEIYNTDDAPLDISGFTLSDALQVRHTFPAGTILGGKTGYVIFGEITNPADFGCPVTRASTGSVGLNNGGDQVILRNSTGGELTRIEYSGEGGSNQSLARSPDFTGPVVQHTMITSNPIQFSPCEFNAIAGLILPVDLVTLTAATIGKTIEIKWRTENELDNDYFIVERSDDGTQWQEIGAINAGQRIGNSYALSDADPLEGANIYRLRQYDLDGTMTIFGPVSATLTTHSFSVYPNPTGDRLNFNRPVREGEAATIFDSNGKVLRRLTVGAHEADVTNLHPGMYLLRLQQGGSFKTIRFIKQ